MTDALYCAAMAKCGMALSCLSDHLLLRYCMFAITFKLALTTKCVLLCCQRPIMLSRQALVYIRYSVYSSSLTPKAKLWAPSEFRRMSQYTAKRAPVCYCVIAFMCVCVCIGLCVCAYVYVFGLVVDVLCCICFEDGTWLLNMVAFNHPPLSSCCSWQACQACTCILDITTLRGHAIVSPSTCVCVHWCVSRLSAIRRRKHTLLPVCPYIRLCGHDRSSHTLAMPFLGFHVILYVLQLFRSLYVV